MISRFLTMVVAVLAIGVGFARGGLAETMTIGAFAKVTIPDAWNPREIERGVEAKSPDEEVYIWVESFNDDTIQTVMAEHESYFTRQGVTVTGKTKTVEATRNGLQIKILDVPAIWKGKRTVLQYAIVDAGLPSGRKLLLTEWASPDGEKTYDPDTTAILDSVVLFGR